MSSLLDLVSTFVLNGSRIAIAGGSYHPRISDNYAVLQRTYGSDCECDCDCQGTDCSECGGGDCSDCNCTSDDCA